VIGLIGSTGEIGQQTLRYLHDKNVAVCLLGRDLSKLQPYISPPHITTQHFDFTKPNIKSFNGIKVLLWTLPTNINHALPFEAAWLALAKQAEIEHIVKLSVMRTEMDDLFHHRASEQAIENSGIAYTHLRPNTFMQNFNNYEQDLIKNKHQLRFPAGEGKTSFIDTRRKLPQ
jgi:uncharacterized protein YbjT (DUF2867 family)